MKLSHQWLCGVLFVSCVCTSAACGERKAAITSEEVRASIARELAPGVPADEIESFFKRHNVDFGWNRFEGIYNGVIRDVEPFRGITIRVFVDNERRFISAEVRDAYTAP
jgi:hypothetical protein